MAAGLTTPVPALSGLAASYGDPEADLHTIYLFAVRYGNLETIAELDKELGGAMRQTVGTRRKAREKALYDAAFDASMEAPNDAIDEVWPLMERIDPYPEPEFIELSEKGLELLARVDEDIQAGRTIKADWDDPKADEWFDKLDKDRK